MRDPTQAHLLLAAAIAQALQGTTDNQGRYLVVEACVLVPTTIIASAAPNQLHVHLYDAPGGNRLLSLSWPIAAGHSLQHIAHVVRTHVTNPGAGP